MIVVTHPWFMSCSVSSSHMRTCMALPSRMKWKMSSMARLLCSPVSPLWSPVSPLWSPVWPSTRCITITAGCWCAQVCCCPAVPSSHQPKTGQP